MYDKDYDKDKFDKKHKNDIKHEIEDIMLFQAVFSSVIFILIVLFFKNMYYNKFGECASNKSDLSDVDMNEETLFTIAEQDP